MYNDKNSEKNSKNLHSVYEIIAEHAGLEIAEEVHCILGGQTILFPKNMNKSEYNYGEILRLNSQNLTANEVAAKMDVTERRIRDIYSRTKKIITFYSECKSIEAVIKGVKISRKWILKIISDCEEVANLHNKGISVEQIAENVNLPEKWIQFIIDVNEQK